MCLNPLGKGRCLYTIYSHRKWAWMFMFPVRFWEGAFAAQLQSHHCPQEQVPGVPPGCSSQCQVIGVQVPSLSLLKNPS